VWCFVNEGAIELSVSADAGVIRLYVMDTDEELAFADAESLGAWLEAQRAHALQDVPRRPDGKARIKGFFEWS
jgi:hypothetical protein